MNALLRIHQASQRIDGPVTTWLGSLVLLALRWHVGWQFFKSGLVKISDWSATLALFHDEYKVPLLPPDLAAYVGAFGELFFPLLLFLGLFSRPAALGLFGVNAMAVISYPQLFGFECPAAINDHFFWGAGLLVLVAFGAGRFAVDAWINRAASDYR
jgi:putative oxidoreductase